MKNLLQINSSLFAEGGQSSQLAKRFVDGWKAAHPNARVTIRDVAKNPIPHLDGATFGAFLAKPEDRTPAQVEAARVSDDLVAELKAADVLVIGLPLYNFGVPSTLKAWIDQVMRAGQTFKYTAEGPVGLVTGKKAYVFAARGGYYKGTPKDTQAAYVRDLLAFIGITDVEFVYAEGLAVGEAAKREAIAGANRDIDALVAPLALAA